MNMTFMQIDLILYDILSEIFGVDYDLLFSLGFVFWNVNRKEIIYSLLLVDYSTRD